MFFNVKKVANFLLKNGHVYTLRKKRKRLGNDVAVVGKMFNHKTIAKIVITEVSPIGVDYVPMLLKPFVRESGLFNAERGEYGSACEWATLARKLSGKDLRLYRVEVRKE